MRTKTQKSGVRGQALVMVTMGLIAMCGLMGLAVDLGWSYFVEKQAQTAADAAAIGAVQEAYRRGVNSGFVCPVAPSGATQTFCQPTEATCATINSPNNLLNGCLYGQQNGFSQGGLGGRQTLRIQASDSSMLPPTAPGVGDIAYWVTVRATQTVPQLFSSVLGNTEGLVSARATAAVVGSIVPGAFYALNQEGDCIGTGTGFTALCGVDIDLQGANGATCNGGGGVTAAICAATGIVLASTCHGVSQLGCGSGGGKGKGGATWAGQTQGAARVWAAQAQVRTGIDSNGAVQTGDVDDHSKWTPVPTPTADPRATSDPYQGVPQPPLQVPPLALGRCGILNGAINQSGGSPLVLGPYQYYAYELVDGNPVATGDQIVLNGNVQFANTGSCPSGGGVTSIFTSGATTLNGNFPAYLFYGGLRMGDNTNFGPGQYIMVGTNTVGGDALTLKNGNPNVTGDQGAGTQFITTNLGYPGLSSQTSNIAELAPFTSGSVTLYQGSINMKAGNSSSVQLDGLDKSSASLPATLDKYNGNVFWQDRRNSTLIFDPNGNVLAGAAGHPCNVAQGGISCGNVSDAPGLVARGVTSTSPRFIYNASAQLNITGSLYQPRGAWFSMQGSADLGGPFQIITGMVDRTGSGTINLAPNSLPIIRFRVALIH